MAVVEPSGSVASVSVTHTETNYKVTSNVFKSNICISHTLNLLHSLFLKPLNGNVCCKNYVTLSCKTLV